jgi:shikimate dehydrogenase
MPFTIKTQQEPTMYFIGVSTSRSSIMKVFPLWMAELNRPGIGIEGVDLKLHDQPEAYRGAVLQIKNDPLSLGALVTSHKISLLDATRDLFDDLDRYAKSCGEVSCISKRSANIEGHAKDPITAGASLDSMLGRNYFARTGGHVLALGAGGSTTAILLHFVEKKDRGDRPERIVVVNRSPERLKKLKTMLAGFDSPIEIEPYCHTDPRDNDRLLPSLPPYSLIINATGMGKDLPGSPLTGNTVFPLNSIAWELNYRGELEFLHQALAQQQSRRVVVEDGWLYFLHGWTSVISQVLKVDIDNNTFDRLAAIAASICVPVLPPRDYPLGESLLHGSPHRSTV